MIIDFRIQGTGDKFFVGGYGAMPAFMERYKALYDFQRLCNLPFEEFMAEMERSGVSLAVLHAEYAYGDADHLNKTVGGFATSGLLAGGVDLHGALAGSDHAHELALRPALAAGHAHPLRDVPGPLSLLLAFLAGHHRQPSALST